MLKGIDITLYEKTQSGTDEADAPVYTVARNGDYMVKTFAEIMPFAFTSFKKD